MKNLLCVYDAYDIWAKEIYAACNTRRDRWDTLHLHIGDEIPRDAHAFIRPDMNEQRLLREKAWLKDHVHRPELHLITDATQIMLYEDKCAQAKFFEEHLPPTWVFTCKAGALEWIEKRKVWPIVSKASVGASSEYVEVISKDQAIEKVQEAFGPGIDLRHPNWDRQKGYVLFQHFLPGNSFTWRVNVIGNEVALFRRFNHPNKPTAQTGNTEPVTDFTAEVEAVCMYARSVARSIDSKWVALDILRDYQHGGLYLLETSLAWPWPGVGRGALFFPSRRPWIQMFELMFDQAEQGVFL